MIDSYLQFIPILVSILIGLGTFYVKNRRIVKKVLIVNFVVIAIFYVGLIYVHHLNYIYEAFYEVTNEVLTEYFLKRAYQLSYHIFAILIFSGINLLVLFKHYPKIETNKT